MNLAVRRFFLFFFSFALFAACEDPTDIGIDLQETNKIGTDYVDTLTVRTGTVLLSDSVLTYRTSPALIGAVNDPALGQVRATYYTQLNLGGTDLSFGMNPKADSIVLTLDYKLLSGKSDNPVTIKVYELAEGFQEKESYFANSELARKSNLLGSKTVIPRILSRDVNGTKTDSARLIRIKLDPALSQSLIAQSGKDALKNQTNFTNFLKGIALVVEGNSDAQLIALNILPNTAIKSNKTALTLYYKESTDSRDHSFLLYGPDIKSFTNISSNRAGTALAGLQQNLQHIPSAQTSGLSYVQAGTQLFTKLSIPFLHKLKEKHGNFVINRAELIIPVQDGSTSLFAVPQRLALYITNNSNRVLKDKDGNPISVQMSSVGSTTTNLFPTALVYNSDKNHYSVNITSYLQSVLLGAKDNNSLLLAPVTFTQGANGAAQITPEIFPYRAILSNTAGNGVKLRIYFSKLN
jgi:hypothetical protein